MNSKEECGKGNTGIWNNVFSFIKMENWKVGDIYDLSEQVFKKILYYITKKVRDITMVYNRI